MLLTGSRGLVKIMDFGLAQLSGSSKLTRGGTTLGTVAHGFEYKRHGTLSLYAALNTRTGQVQGKTAARHTGRLHTQARIEQNARPALSRRCRTQVSV
jgi:hypothetical protein